MRLSEFTNPKNYISTDADTENLLEQINRMWPPAIKNDGAPLPQRLEKRPPNDRPQSSAQG
jgi:hypothetical protein